MVVGFRDMTDQYNSRTTIQLSDGETNVFRLRPLADDGRRVRGETATLVAGEGQRVIEAVM